MEAPLRSGRDALVIPVVALLLKLSVPGIDDDEGEEDDVDDRGDVGDRGEKRLLGERGEPGELERGRSRDDTTPL